MADVWFFGCYREAGHFLHREGGLKGADANGSRELPEGCPFQLHNFDAGFLVGANKYAARIENQGEGVLVHQDGWTYLSFWDRTVDTRGACNSGFLAEGELTFDEIVERAKEVFPEVWERFPFEVRLRP